MMRTSIFLLFYIKSVCCDLCFNRLTGNTFYCQSRCCDYQCCVAYEDDKNWSSDEVAGAVVGTLLGGTILVLVMIYIVRNFCLKRPTPHSGSTATRIAIISNGQSEQIPMQSAAFKLSRYPPSYEESQATVLGSTVYSRFQDEE
ncbi:uncharacterized protein LOC133194999 [Saccostrea echinata]|uniref:uncharacterized protein LOC133194999 n=1 Tax=Saccostrea echinata TaxID=191078 RepID=UPI002A7F7520|nr:uncharacterized protein LOC133194999 [Saccostrea echinata]